MHRGMIWVDIGMGLVIFGFVALVVFLEGTTIFGPVMVAYVLGVTVWAFVAEWAASRAEQASMDQRGDASVRGATPRMVPPALPL